MSKKECVIDKSVPKKVQTTQNVMQRIKLNDFINRLRIIASIDADELEDAGIFDWKDFQRDPYKWLMRADDEKAAKLWALIEKRSKR